MRKLKIIVDILMFIIFLTLMGYHITGNLIHEILGITIFILFIIHFILNIRWYKTLFKGKYNTKRIILTIIDISLLLCMIGMIISAIMISNNVFAFLNIPINFTWVKLHRFCSSWGFIIMSFHLGMHIDFMIKKFDTKFMKSDFVYTYYIILLAILGFGIYSYINSKLYEDMFMLTEFKYINNASGILFYIKYLLMVLMICEITHFVPIITKKIKKK